MDENKKNFFSVLLDNEETYASAFDDPQPMSVTETPGISYSADLYL